MVNLDVLLSTEDLLIVDASVRGGRKNKIIHELVDFRNCPEIASDILMHEKKSIEFLERILKNKNAYTIFSVAEEINKVMNIVRKIRTENSSKGGRNNMKRERTKLTELGELFSRVYKLALKKDIQNEDNFYNFDSMRYAGILTEINKILRLKRDMGYCFGLHETDRSICSNTDEQLVSAAACLAEAGRHPAIIAEDIDIQRLAKYGLGILYAPEFSPRNNRAAEYLAESRVRVYLPEDNKDYNSADNGSYGQVYISPLTFGWSVEKIIEELWRGDKARKKFEKPSIEKIEQISEKVHDFWKNL